MTDLILYNNKKRDINCHLFLLQICNKRFYLLFTFHSCVCMYHPLIFALHWMFALTNTNVSHFHPLDLCACFELWRCRNESTKHFLHTHTKHTEKHFLTKLQCRNTSIQISYSITILFCIYELLPQAITISHCHYYHHHRHV